MPASSDSGLEFSNEIDLMTSDQDINSVQTTPCATFGIVVAYHVYESLHTYIAEAQCYV